jgi:hypothetical protein
VHFLPDRSLFSDSFTSAAGVSPASWFAASLEVIAAVTLAATGIAVLRARGGLVSAAEPYAGERTLREGILHPLSLAMIAGMVITLAVSFAQL